MMVESSLFRKATGNKYLWPAALCVALTILILTVYGQVKDHDFIRYKDNPHIIENKNLLSGFSSTGLSWAFTANPDESWAPLTGISYLADYRLYGLHATGYHLTNLFLHLANVLLLFLILNRLTGALWTSAFVTALFALHPLQVEPVAWVSARGNLLGAFFSLLAVGMYVFYAVKPSLKKYLIVMLCLTLSLLAGPLGIAVPFLLLMIDRWPLRRKESPFGTRGFASGKFAIILEKIPFIVLAIVAVFMHMTMQTSAASPLPALMTSQRLAGMVKAFVQPLAKIICPQNLAVFYPEPAVVTWTWIITGGVILLTAITIAALLAWKRFPYLAFGWLWYLVTLTPIIGLLPTGEPFTADRYTYLSLTGLFIMLAWSVDDLLQDTRYRKQALSLLAAIILMACTLATWQQLQVWKNTVTVFQHAIRTTTDNYLAHNHLGVSAIGRLRFDEAVRHLGEAVRIKPDDAEAHNNLGVALGAQGYVEEAMEHYARAIRLNHEAPMPHVNMAILLLQDGKPVDAMNHLKEALRIQPDHAYAAKVMQDMSTYHQSSP